MTKFINITAYALAVTFLLCIFAALVDKQARQEYAPQKFTFTSCSDGVCTTDISYE